MSRPPVDRCPRCRGPLETSPPESRTCGRCGYRLSCKNGVWLSPIESTPPRFDGAAAARLADLDDRGHFWPAQRRRFLARLLDRIGARGASALELGCGTGAMLPELEARFANVIGVDAHPALLVRARERTPAATLVQADVSRVPFTGASADLVVAFDVIEHVDPDALLAEARRLVRPGGRLLLSAPAFQSLWSEMDDRAGHRCRYRWKQLAAEFDRNGWRAEGHTHFQALLFPLVYLSRRLGGGSVIERRPPRPLNAALAAILGLEVRCLGHLTLPFGSSLVGWASARP